MDARFLEKPWPEIIEWFPKEVLSLDNVLEKLLVASKPSKEVEGEKELVLHLGVFRVSGSRVVLIEAIIENGEIVKCELSDQKTMDIGFVVLRQKLSEFN